MFHVSLQLTRTIAACRRRIGHPLARRFLVANSRDLCDFDRVLDLGSNASLSTRWFNVKPARIVTNLKFQGHQCPVA